MKIGLSFCLAQDETSKVAEFPSVKLKEAYVSAEFSDLRCQKVFLDYQAARTIPERKRLASIVDDTRYAFYTRWAKKNLPERKFPYLQPVDDLA